MPRFALPLLEFVFIQTLTSYFVNVSMIVWSVEDHVFYPCWYSANSFLINKDKIKNEIQNSRLYVNFDCGFAYMGQTCVEV
jgi:hypothetical protein